MGEIQIKKVALDLEDTDYPGHTIICRTNIPEEVHREMFYPDGERSLRQQMETFAKDVIQLWDLEEKGKAIPPTLEGIVRLPVEFQSVILMKWLAAYTEAPEVIPENVATSEEIPTAAPINGIAPPVAEESNLDLAALSTPA